MKIVPNAACRSCQIRRGMQDYLPYTHIYRHSYTHTRSHILVLVVGCPSL